PINKGETTPNLFPLHVVEWVRLGYNVPILIKFGVYAPRVHPNYKGRVSLTQGASLLVEGLTQEDEGWFECRILLLDSKTDDFQNGTWTFLSITAPPVFIKTPPTFVEVLLGDSLTLSCGAHGNPRPTVAWHKDENPIEKHEKIKVLNGSLSLASVTRNISGVYKCHVSNSEGNLTHSTQLQVKGPPIILISPEDTTLNMSQDAVLQCQADAYPSNLTYEWMKQGQNVYHIESLKSRVKVLVDGTLLIPNLIPEDAGNYTCIPTNGILTPPSASAHLKVKHPARVTRMPRETYLPAGMEGVIVCPVQADPPVLYVNWTKDGNRLNLDNFPGWMVNSEGSVFIARANDNAVGMYTCTPYNSYGTMGQSEPTKVILKDPPTFKVSPRPEYLQEVGRELIIPCEAFGDPSPNITWSKYMRPIDHRRGPQRSYLPRGISWPSPYYSPCPPPCEGESYRQTERMMGRPGDLEYREVREGGRASYASQSSGHGSAGLYRQSLSITPTLLSSPETTEESERHMEFFVYVNRRNTSVDESYEWDTADVCVDVEVLEAMRLDQSNAFWKGTRDQCIGLQDHQQKGTNTFLLSYSDCMCLQSLM
uniref:Ig-like domain-containing protein n=1 Tax=Periophthalmus magnuspinnatus TaxID=409849 RepID=A0A3B4B9M1_9GOBI